MSLNFTRKEMNQAKDNFKKMLAYDAKMNKKHGGIYLWDTFEMANMIINHMVSTNKDYGFSDFYRTNLYLAAQLKYVKSQEVIDLLLDFYKYGICHYTATIYGTRIFDVCKHGRSYIYAIFELIRDNNDFIEKAYFHFRNGWFMMFGGEMRFAELVDNEHVTYKYPGPEADIELEEELKKLFGEEKYYELKRRCDKR